jgi:hypothetical protein
MTTATLPGIDPPITRDYYYRLPRRAVDLSKGRRKVYLFVLGHLDDGASCGTTNAAIARATGLSIGTVGPAIAWLASHTPPGLDHPYVAVTGGTRGRRIHPLYLPKGASDQQPAIRMASHSNPGPIRMASHSNPEADFPPEVPASQAVLPLAAAEPLFEDLGERKNVDVIPLPSETPPRTHARGDAGPVAPPVAAVHPEPVAPPVAPKDRTSAGIMRRLQAAAERAAAAEAREAVEAVERGATGPQTPQTVAARQMATPPPAPAPAPHVETPDLIRRLKSQGAAVLALVVARLCERLDPEFEPCYRRCCEDVLAGRLDVGVVIAGFHWARNAPRHGRKKGPSFAAYVKGRREAREEKLARMHRRE